MADQALLNTTDAANKIGVKPETICRWINANKIRAFKVGNEWRISPADLARCLNQNSNMGPQ